MDLKEIYLNDLKILWNKAKYLDLLCNNDEINLKSKLSHLRENIEDFKRFRHISIESFVNYKVEEESAEARIDAENFHDEKLDEATLSLFEAEDKVEEILANLDESDFENDIDGESDSQCEENIPKPEMRKVQI